MIPWIYEHILTLIMASPLVGILILLIIPRRHEEASSEIALVSTSLTLFLSIIMFGFFNGNNRFTFTETYSWLPWFDTAYRVGVDGLGAMLIIVISALALFIVLINWRGVKVFRKEAYASFLFFELGLLGLFSSTDILLMYVFMEITVVALGMTVLFFRGAKENLHSNYLGFMSVASLFLLAVVVFLMIAAGSSNLLAVEQVVLSKQIGVWVLILLLISTAIRTGLFPFHDWTCNINEKSIDFILLPVVLLFIAAAYFFYRLLPPLAGITGLGSVPLTWIIAASIILTALASTVQRNFGSLIMYVARVHFGFILLGIISLNPQSFTGSGIELISSAFTFAAITVVLVFLNRKGVSLEQENMKGVLANNPLSALFFMIILLSVAGLPGLAQFPGLFMIWMGLFKGSWVLTLVALIGLLLITVPLIRFIGITLLKKENMPGEIMKFSNFYFLLISILVVIIVGIGIFPDVLLNNIRQSTEAAWKIFSQQI